MQCVDLKLSSAPKPPDWEGLENAPYMCAGCLKEMYTQWRDQLFYFHELDYVFHRHSDKSFNRAFIVTFKGDICIAPSDSESENVIQLICIYLDGKGDFKLKYNSMKGIQKASNRFFKAMRAKKREIIPSRLTVRSGYQH